MKILICDNLNEQVYKELEIIGDCIDISKSESKKEDLIKHINDCEIVVIRSATKLTKEMLAFKKPGNGIPTNDLNKIINKRTNKDLLKDELLDYKFLEMWI